MKPIFPKALYWYGLAAYAILAGLAILHYKERIIFIDAAFQLFSVLRTNELAIQCDRFGAFFTQGVPLLTSRMGWSLQWVMISYSLSFVAMPTAAFVIAYRLRQEKIAFTVLGVSVFMMTYTFYWVQSEFIQGLVFSLAVAAWMQYRQSLDQFSALELALFPLCLITIVYFHPLLILPFFFIIIYFYIDKSLSSKLLWFTFLFVIFTVIGKSLFFGTAGYDNNAISKTGNFITLFPYYFTTNSFKIFWLAALRDYYLLTAAWLLLLGYYITTKKYLKLGLVGGGFFAYTLLLNVSFPNAEQFYIESHWLGLAVIVFLPFAYDILPLVSARKMIIILPILLVIRLLHIHFAHQPFTERLDWQRELMQKWEGLASSKILMPLKNVPMDKLWMDWGISYEFLYLSTLEAKRTYSVIFDDQPQQFDWVIGRRDAFITEWGTFDYKGQFPVHYFPMNDTSAYLRWENGQ